MWKLHPKISPSRAQLVVAVTVCFLIVASILAVLIMIAVRDMTTSATVIDDARASRAATAAVHALEARLSATLRDNSVWDDGYRQIMSDNAKNFAETTWGRSTEDNPLFDIAVVLTAEHTVLSSYNKGSEFDAIRYFGPSLIDIVSIAEASGRSPAVSFMLSPEGLVLVAASDIQPYAKATADIRPRKTLVLGKFMSNETLSQISDTFDLAGLQMALTPEDGLLNIPLVGENRQTLAYLQWPSRNPGAMIYDRAHRYLFAAAAVLATFLIGVLVTGVLAVRLLQRSAAHAQHSATHDVLSGLLNRAGLLEQLNRAIASGQQDLSLHLIDLDGFKGVNDAWGHAVGDELIKLVAVRVAGRLPETALFARLGGDEFAAVTRGHDTADLAQSIVACVAEPFFIGGRTIEVGASVGTVTCLHEVPDALEVVRRADMALYTAKESGRGRAIDYTPALDRDRQDIVELENKLRKAFADGEIGVVYQPLVDAKAGALSGVEALARWVPPTGRISPEIFIPIAERSGLIDQLGMHVLETALDQATCWQGLSLSVNVSPIQLRNPNFAADVIAVLRTKNFDPHRLTLEITEGVLLSNPEHAHRAITSLHEIGVRFALDDFGSGYASIGALRTFGFDRMKIDRSLVNALDSKRGVEVLMATISLAQALNIPVTAEGVETQQQLDLLRQSGCDQLQGYFIGKPMAAADMAALLISTAA